MTTEAALTTTIGPKFSDQRNFFRQIGLPVIPGTFEPILNYDHLVIQLKQAQLLTGDGGQQRLVAPIWLKAPNATSLACKNMDELALRFGMCRLSHSSTDIVVEQFFESASLAILQLDSDSPEIPNPYLEIKRIRGSFTSSLYLDQTGLGKSLISLTLRAAQVIGNSGKVTAKFLVDGETGQYYILKVKERFERPMPSEVEMAPVQKEEYTIKKEPPRITPAYLSEWMKKNGLLSGTLENDLDIILKLSARKKADLQKHLVQMPSECCDAILSLIESLEDPNKKSQYINLLTIVFKRRAREALKER